MYLSGVIALFLLVGMVIVGIQNSIPVSITFLTWNIQLSSTALIFYSSLAGAAVVAILALPKLARKSIDVKKLNKEVFQLKEIILKLER